MKVGQREGLWYAHAEQHSLTVSGYEKRENAVLMLKMLCDFLERPSYEVTTRYQLCFHMFSVMRERGIPV